MNRGSLHALVNMMIVDRPPPLPLVISDNMTFDPASLKARNTLSPGKRQARHLECERVVCVKFSKFFTA